MPRRCSICDHVDLDAINMTLIDCNESLRSIAVRFGVSRSSLTRHRDAHLPATLALAQRANDGATADSLLDRLLHLANETLAILAMARKENEHVLALAAIARAEQQIALQARLIGELQSGITINTNILVTSQEWLQLRGRILVVLDNYPEARQAMLDAIQ